MKISHGTTNTGHKRKRKGYRYVVMRFRLLIRISPSLPGKTLTLSHLRKLVSKLMPSPVATMMVGHLRSFRLTEAKSALI